MKAIARLEGQLQLKARLVGELEDAGLGKRSGSGWFLAYARPQLNGKYLSRPPSLSPGPGEGLASQWQEVGESCRDTGRRADA